MATLDLINVGTTADDGTGDLGRAAFAKSNTNDTALNNDITSINASVSTLQTDMTTVQSDILLKQVDPLNRVVVNSLSDFPTAVAGVITLAPSTQYLLGTDISLGTDRVVMQGGTALSGIESLVVTLSYLGTGDMITIVDSRVRINNLSISCPSGRAINFSDSTDSIFRMNDVSLVCDRFGLFNSTGSGGSTVRFTNVSPSVMTTDGITITGDWNTWFYEISAANVTSGAYFNLGTATFKAFVLDLVLSPLSSGTNLLSGAPSSANIVAGGQAEVTRTITSGLGTPLSGITVEDARWDFQLNSAIPNTRPDGLLSLAGNTTETVISSSGTPVLVAGTWSIIRSSQYTGTVGGRLTYDGVRAVTTPITVSTTVETAGGGAGKNITLYLASGGSIIADSVTTNKVSGNDPKSTTIVWQLIAQPSEYFEIYIQNDSDTTNLVVTDAKFRVN